MIIITNSCLPQTNEEEDRYECEAHNYQKLQADTADATSERTQSDPLRNLAGTPSSPPMTLSPSDSDLGDLSKRFTRMSNYNSPHCSTSQREALVRRNRNGMGPSVSGLQNNAMTTDPSDGQLEEELALLRPSL